MGNKLNRFVLFIFLIIFGGIGTWVLVSILRPAEDVDQSNTLHWLPAESYFVDYEIVGDDVQFRYAICFVNNSGCDLKIKASVKFHASSLAGWAAEKDFLSCCNENGEWDYQEIKNGEKKVIVYSFTTQYLGGPVNTDLPFPEEILLSQQIL